jgi:hypothetical protein
VQRALLRERNETTDIGLARGRRLISAQVGQARPAWIQRKNREAQYRRCSWPWVPALARKSALGRDTVLSEAYGRRRLPASPFEVRRKSMKHRSVVVLIALALAAGIPPARSQQPYAGLEARPIKALSEEQIADLRAGRGMGLALAAELNGYPGPMHVLELADALGLSEQQRAAVERLFAGMRSEAVPLGEQLIAQEADLDRQFAGKTITPASLVAATDAIGATHAALRRAHLRYHLFTAELLTPAQVRHYAELRGYKAGMRHPHGRH